MTLFASGYSATSGKAATPTTAALAFSCESTPAPATSCAAKNAVACVGVTALRARGREAVLPTFLSRSRSQRSLMVQPAPRRSNEPSPKSRRRCAVSGGEEERESETDAAAAEEEEEVEE